MSTRGTPWERGRLDGRPGPRQLLFGRMYEDAAIELDAFRSRRRILCIASAGCTALELAPHHDVVAVDINPVQLAYARERFAGDPARRGRAERLLDALRFLAPLAGWSPRRVRAFLALDRPAAQVESWRRDLDTRRFRWAFDALLSAAALRAAYAPHLLAALPRRPGPALRARLERGFARHPNRDNPYAHALLAGTAPPEAAPPGAPAIRLVHADAASFLEAGPAAAFDGFALSNILDGVDDAYRARLWAVVRRAAAPGAVAVVRSFGDADADAPGNRAADDRSLLWGSVLVRPVAVT